MKTLALAILIGFLSMPVSAQTVLDVGMPLPRATPGLGINTNFLTDDDGTHLPVDRTQTSALYSAGMRYWRFPEGELADDYLWSVPPYWQSAPALARTGQNEWPANDRRFTWADNATLKNTMTFDEFMHKANAAGAIPIVTVAYDSMYKAATEGGTAPTRSQLVRNAVEWVKYARRKGYRVQYWEIGNESYHRSWIGSAPSAQVYAADLIEFSRAMKAVDPAILIGANGIDRDGWWGTVLQTAAGSIDWMSLHVYPVWGWGSFEYYRQNDPPLTTAVQNTLRDLDTYAMPVDRARIKLAVTEFAPIDWAPSATWSAVNDMGHALVAFDLFGALALEPRVLFSQYWVSRWTDGAGYNMLTSRNGYTPQGQALAIWGQSLGIYMAMAYEDRAVKIFITGQASGQRHVLMRNKSDRAYTVQLKNAGTKAWRRVFAGNGQATDTAPSYWQIPARVVGDTVALPPLSITVLTIN